MISLFRNNGLLCFFQIVKAHGSFYAWLVSTNEMSAVGSLMFERRVHKVIKEMIYPHLKRLGEMMLSEIEPEVLRVAGFVSDRQLTDIFSRCSEFEILDTPSGAKVSLMKPIKNAESVNSTCGGRDCTKGGAERSSESFPPPKDTSTSNSSQLSGTDAVMQPEIRHHHATRHFAPGFRDDFPGETSSPANGGSSHGKASASGSTMPQVAIGFCNSTAASTDDARSFKEDERSYAQCCTGHSPRMRLEPRRESPGNCRRDRPRCCAASQSAGLPDCHDEESKFLDALALIQELVIQAVTKGRLVDADGGEVAINDLVELLIDEAVFGNGAVKRLKGSPLMLQAFRSKVTNALKGASKVRLSEPDGAGAFQKAALVANSTVRSVATGTADPPPVFRRLSHVPCVSNSEMKKFNASIASLGGSGHVSTEDNQTMAGKTTKTQQTTMAQKTTMGEKTTIEQKTAMAQTTTVAQKTAMAQKTTKAQTTVTEQKTAMARKTTKAQKRTIEPKAQKTMTEQETAMAQTTTLARKTTKAQKRTNEQKTAIAQTTTKAQKTMTEQKTAMAQTTTLTQKTTLAQKTTTEQKTAMARKTTKAQKRTIEQKTAIAQTATKAQKTKIEQKTAKEKSCGSCLPKPPRRISREGEKTADEKSSIRRNGADYNRYSYECDRVDQKCSAAFPANPKSSLPVKASPSINGVRAVSREGAAARAPCSSVNKAWWLGASHRKPFSAGHPVDQGKGAVSQTSAPMADCKGAASPATNGMQESFGLRLTSLRRRLSGGDQQGFMAGSNAPVFSKGTFSPENIGSSSTSAEHARPRKRKASFSLEEKPQNHVSRSSDVHHKQLILKFSNSYFQKDPATKTLAFLRAGYRHFRHEKFAQSRLAFEGYVLDQLVAAGGRFEFGNRHGKLGATWLFYRPSRLAEKATRFPHIELLQETVDWCISRLTSSPKNNEDLDALSRLAAEKFRPGVSIADPAELTAIFRCLILIGCFRNSKYFVFAKTEPRISLRKPAACPEKRPVLLSPEASSCGVKPLADYFRSPLLSTPRKSSTDTRISQPGNRPDLAEALNLLSCWIRNRGPLKRNDLRDVWSEEAKGLKKIFGEGISFILKFRKYEKFFPKRDDGTLTVKEEDLKRFIEKM